MKHYYLTRIVLILCMSFGLSNAWSQDVTTFSYTGGPDTYTVPPGVYSIQVETYGAQGQAITDEQYDESTGGLGGYAIGTLAVTPGEVLNVYVGGTGTEPVAGFNGGGLGGYGTPSDGDAGRAGSGGGASDIRQGGAALGDRVIVGGGGGGGGRDYVNGTCQPCGTGGNGGAGGALVGTDGDDPADDIYGFYFNPGSGGKGGTGIAGGAGGDGPEGPDGEAGSLGNGGNGRDGNYSVASGGAGGGYYGGGSGAGANSGSGDAGGGGAGGSSYLGALTDAATSAGIRSGNGEVIISVLCTALTVTATDTEICFGEEITLDAESETGGGITWDEGVTDEVAFTPLGSGIITYTATSDAETDCATSIDILVNELPIVNAGSGDENYCDGETVVLAAGGNADVWNWDPTDLEPGIGTHTYTLTGTDSETGCEATDEVTITVHALPSVSASADEDEICLGNSVVLTGGGADTYVWDPADVEDGESYTPALAGTYTFTVIGTDEFGCTDEATVSVAVNAEISITYVVTEEMIFEDGEIDITVTGGVAPYTFDWDIDGTGDFDDDEDLTGLADALYNVVVNGANGCSASAMIVLGTQAGVDELNQAVISVYPNPTHDLVTIALAGTFSYELIAVNGDVILKGIATDKEIINMKSFANGVYFISVTSAESSNTVKILKQ
ncbi:MAG: T9SS type A sorting domain-containing protein [Crocinitomix sp.]|nr:T9SS type A sorting domain-containing protein [Crocinitomix sp.]